jgi:putative endonuclease
LCSTSKPLIPSLSRDPKSMSDFFVYILRCNDGSFYTGHADNLEARAAQHNSGILDGYTAARKPVELVWSQTCGSREQALSNERQLKNWSRAKKIALVAGDWHALALAAKSRRA